MALSRPALEVLGISPAFARTHPESVVIAVSDAIYRAAMGRYHPDKGDSVPVPSAVNLAGLQEARDLVRSDVKACIREIGRGERTSRETKQVADLGAQVAELKRDNDSRLQDIVMLWRYIAYQKLGVNSEDRVMGDAKKASYSIRNLNGLGILVVTDDKNQRVFEYLCHEGVWFKRPLVKVLLSRASPCPPNIPPELISTYASEDGRGYFYDQESPHVIQKEFEILGSYTKAALAAVRRRKSKKEQKEVGPSPKAPVFIAGGGVTGSRVLEFDPLVASVLKPSVTVGSVLQSTMLASGGLVQYDALGIIMGIRVFDSRQRS